MVHRMDQDTKVRENRMRRAAERRGYRLTKSRRKDPYALGYGLFRVETADGVEVAGFYSPDGLGLTLDEVERRFSAGPPAAR
jgi:hypothetical protein